MHTFLLNRLVDETGISGTGEVAEGVIFSDGTCVLRWLTEHRSTSIYASIDEVRAIHGHAGKTEIVIRPDEAAVRSAALGVTTDAAQEALEGQFEAACPRGEKFEHIAKHAIDRLSKTLMEPGTRYSP